LVKDGVIPETADSNYIKLNQPLKRTLLQYVSLGLSENIESSLCGQRMIPDFILYHMLCNTDEALTKRIEALGIEINGDVHQQIKKDRKSLIMRLTRLRNDIIPYIEDFRCTTRQDVKDELTRSWHELARKKARDENNPIAALKMKVSDLKTILYFPSLL
jgi:hypothetical protein